MACPGPARSRRSSPAEAGTPSPSRSSATSRTATTTGSCCPRCWPTPRVEAVDNEDTDGEDELYLNPLGWYDENGITLHAGVRIVRIDRHAKVVYGDDGSVTPYDTSFSPPAAAPSPRPWRACGRRRPSLTPGVFGFRSLDDATGMLAVVVHAWERSIGRVKHQVRPFDVGLGAEELRLAVVRMNEASERWRALPNGGSLTLTWPRGLSVDTSKTRRGRRSPKRSRTLARR